MANKKKTYLLYSLKPDLQYSEGRSYDVKICVDEIATLPPMLRTGDKVIAYDIFTDFPSIDFMLSFFDFAMKNGIAFESVTQSYLNFSASRPLPYKITNYLMEMKKFRDQIWSFRSLFGVHDNNPDQCKSFFRHCDWIVGRAISITLSTDGILKR